MKAIKFLKECQKDINDFIESFDECSCDEELHNAKITKIKINEAIVELETLQNRSCSNCKYCHDEVCCNDNSLLCADFVNENFCCNKWESKQ